MPDWNLDPSDKDSRKLIEMIEAQARRLQKTLEEAQTTEQKYAAVFSFYRKYYTWTLKKDNAPINRSPTRDIILDFPWKELKQDRFFCLKIWEKINH